MPLRKDLTAASAVPPSLLSLHLRSEHKQSADATKISSVSSNQKGVTVYGPDREPIEVLIDPADTVAAVIRKTLDAHEAACRTPPLLYRCPQCYDLRLHEGNAHNFLVSIIRYPNLYAAN